MTDVEAAATFFKVEHDDWRKAMALLGHAGRTTAITDRHRERLTLQLDKPLFAYRKSNGKTERIEVIGMSFGSNGAVVASLADGLAISITQILSIEAKL